MRAFSYDEDRARAGRKRLEFSADGREIGDIPDVADPQRKAACERDFRLFAETYFPLTFELAWSDDHIKVIKQIETSVLDGGLFATAMPRGSGKTSLAEVGCIWAVLYGHHFFISLIGSDEGHAEQMLDSIKTELSTNELLSSDFPEAIYPIEKLEGISHRCKGQIHRGERTCIEWGSDVLVMPTIPDSRASGVTIKVSGLTGGIRGMKYKRSDGKAVRPSLVIVDDPQTDQSARSPSQCETRERILAGAILGLAGPGKKISGIMPCTVIHPGDMADRIVNRDLHPEWNGTRTKMVYAFPANEKLWEEYGRIRADSLRAGHSGREATVFYASNRELMDAGAKVAWEARHDPDELSAIQHAMNLRFRDERAFFSEYQNEPLPEQESRGDDLTPDQIAGKLNGLARSLVPLGCNQVTAFIDVQATMLFYAVVAWEDDYTGYVIDYGGFPDQKRPYFTLRDAKVKLASVIKNAGLEGQLYGGLEKLTALLLDRSWEREDGANLKVERCLIDSAWGVSTNLVYQFCRQSSHASVLIPSRGMGIGASSLPMNEYTKRPGDKVGNQWRITRVQEVRGARKVIYDANHWKSFVHSRLAVAMGDRGCLSLWGDKPDQHRCFADHLTAEYRIRTQGRGREVDEWKLRPERPDNHWLDSLAGCAVAAAIQGVALTETKQATAKPAGKRKSFAEAYAEKWGGARA